MAFTKGKKARVSLIRQRDITDCGAACLASICGYYGLYIPVSRVRQYAYTDQKGTSIHGIVEAAAKLGMLAKGMKATYESLRFSTVPAIVHVIVNERLAHYMVLVSAGQKSVLVMDPAIGKICRLSKSTFCKSWTGIIVLILPSERFEKKAKTSLFNRLEAVDSKFKRPIILCSLLAIAISLLGLAVSVYIKEIIDTILPAHNLSAANLFSAGVLVALVIQFILSVIKNRMMLKTGISINRSLVRNYMLHVMQLPVSFYKSMRVGEIVSRVNDAVKITSFVNDVLVNLLVDALIIVFSLILMFVYNWKIALMVVSVLPLYGLLFFIGRRVNAKRQQKLAEAAASFEGTLIESISSATAIRHLRAEQLFSEKSTISLYNVLYQLFGYSSRQLYIQATADVFTKTISILLLWSGSYYVANSELSAGELISLFTLLGYFTGPVLFLLHAGKEVGEARIAAERLFEIMDLAKAVYGTKTLPEQKSVFIEFADVHYSYKRSISVLKGINLTIRPGSITGIKGDSGSGKSTLVSLLLGDNQPQTGVIRINGTDLTEVNKQSIAKIFAIAEQVPTLFTGSLLDNIVLGSEPDLSQLHEICERLGINSFVSDLPGGIQSMIAEGGTNFSVGERQRISLARALYRDAPVLILDEATTAVDFESEKKIMQTIEWYRNKGNTVIIISHCDATLKICDNIAVLENGQIT